MQKWFHDDVPPVGAMGASRLTSIVFPTNQLSAGPLREKMVNVTWLDPAPIGEALAVDILLANEEEQDVISQFSIGGFQILRWIKRLPSGKNLLVSSFAFECGPVDLKMPDSPGLPGKVFREVHFPDIDVPQTGRPVRLHLALKEGVPPQIWELGGYEVGPIPE